MTQTSRPAFSKVTPLMKLEGNPVIRRILDVVDVSNGFMRKGNDLPVGPDQEGAEKLIMPMNHFFMQIPEGTIDFALFKLDTHFEVEYDLSPESGPFPNIHCAYGTDGWKLSVNPDCLNPSIPVYYMTKNTFDMWGENPVPLDDLLKHHNVESFDELPFNSEDEKKAYQNLYNITQDPACLKPGPHRDEFLSNIGPETEIVLIGVASNFCDADAMFGYLERGAQVTVLSNLCKGIPLGPEGREALLDAEGIDRTENGTMQEVLETERFRPFVESGQLRMEHSEDYINRLRNEVSNDSGPPAP